MRYVGDICDSCKTAFLPQDDVVVCPRCGTPHHNLCWQKTKTCVNENRHDEGFIWQPSIRKESEEKRVCGGNIHCPSCGTENDSCEPNCINCGDRIYLNQKEGNSPHGRQKSSPFGYGQAGFGGDVRQGINIDGIPANEVAAYIQGNADIYITKFLRMDQSGRENSFNWAAAFFPYVWLFYRKMYKAAFLSLALFLIISFIPISRIQIENNRASFEIVKAVANNEISFEQAQKDMENLPQQEAGIRDFISLGLKLSLNLLIALKADAFYRKRVVKDILESREEAHDSAGYFALLYKKGGGLVLAAIGGFALYHFLSLFLELYIFNLIF